LICIYHDDFFFFQISLEQKLLRFQLPPRGYKVKKIMILQELIQLGLTDGEARIYASLLKLGSSKVGAIVRDSHVSYSKIYDVLERLRAYPKSSLECLSL
jgi:hypothetical protein